MRRWMWMAAAARPPKFRVILHAELARDPALRIEIPVGRKQSKARHKTAFHSNSIVTVARNVPQQGASSCSDQ